MVEPPGTAPGSDPLITSAFMSIVPKDSSYIGGKRLLAKGGRGKSCRKFCCFPAHYDARNQCILTLAFGARGKDIRSQFAGFVFQRAQPLNRIRPIARFDCVSDPRVQR